MKYVSVHLRDDVSSDIISKKPRLKESAELQSLVSALGLRIEPLHPGTVDRELARHFFVAAPDEQAAEEAQRKLVAAEGVEAAYVKPPEGPPAGK